MTDTKTEWFYFAIPPWASRAQREAAPGHLVREFGVEWATAEHVRSESTFRLYRAQAAR